MLTNVALMGMGLSLAVIVILVLALILAFEIWMFVNAILNKQISDTARILWVVGMLLIHPIVAIVYYFTDYQKTR